MILFIIMYVSINVSFPSNEELRQKWIVAVKFDSVARCDFEIMR